MKKYNDLRLIPDKIEREITFMLYNYNNLDKSIEKRKEEISNKMNTDNISYLKSIKNDSINTVENIAIKISDDRNIKRLEQWKKIINSFKNKLYDEEDKRCYYLIKYKYFDKLDKEVIAERLNLEMFELKKLDIYVKWLIYEYAKTTKLYSEEKKIEKKM